MQANLGYRAMTLSVKEILDQNDVYERRTGQRVSPLFRAYDSWSRLEKSDLRYNRMEKNTGEQYRQMMLACTHLNRDFSDDSKWKR